MKYFLVFFFTFISFSLLNAQQKKVMDHSVYEIWKNIENISVSGDGYYVIYEVNPQKGDGNLIIYSIKYEAPDTLPRGYGAKILSGDNFLVGQVKAPYQMLRQAKKEKKKKEELPGDSLFIYDLEKGSTEKFGKLRNWKAAKEGSPWVVWHEEYRKNSRNTNESDTSQSFGNEHLLSVEEVGSEEKIKSDKKFDAISAEYKLADLVIMNPYSGKSYRYENVSAYDISKNGERIVFHQMSEDSIRVSVVYAFDTDDESLSILFDHDGIVPSMAIDDQGRQIAFLHTADSGMVAGYDLYYWQDGLQEAKIIIDSLSSEFPENWGISKNGKLYFSGESDRLFFGTAPIPEKAPEDTLLDEEKARLDIWSYKDSYLQPQQKKMIEREKKKTWLAYYDIQRKEQVQLADTIMEDIINMHEGNGRYMLGFATEKYAPLLSWEGNLYRDVYLIDIREGSKKMILRKKEERPMLSPFGKYVVYYEPSDSAWYSYEIASGKLVNISRDINYPVYDEINDMPQLPGAYGIAGFLKDDEYVLLYDRYDVWKVDPKAVKPPVNLTGGKGREYKTRYRYVKLDPEAYYIDPAQAIYLSSFNLETMEDGYARIASIDKPIVRQLLYSKDSYSSLQKAKNDDLFVYRKGDFRNYPDLFISDEHFKKEEKISEANPQASEYLWGDVRLVEWTSFNNEKLKGLLYTPEDLDPQKKYPLLVYFYERNSETLYSHRIPSASRSIISIPWCTSNGYVVFVPDITYRTGYPGQSAYDAVISGTEAMLEKYSFIDKDKMGLQGQSWGGYQVAWLVTRTDMFAAAMAGAPVSNMTSAYGGIRWGTGMSRMFQYEKSQSRIGVSLWENPELYIENSPVFYAPDVETPLLIMHNDNDGAVPWYQGIEYFVALRRLGKPVWMLSYNDEEHNLTRWPNRVDLSKRMMGFFDYFLKDESMPLWMKEGIPAVEKGMEDKY